MQHIVLRALHARYVLVGDDFRFGAQRAGDLALLQRMAAQHEFEVGCMQEQSVGGLRVSSTAVRQALQHGDMATVTALLGRPYAISGHVVHGRKLGRSLQAPTLNLRFAHWKPAASGIFVVQVQGLTTDGSDGSYVRSYQETRNEVENTVWVVGIKYKNQKAYDRYKKQYIAFKSSLQQFAD